MPWVLGLGSKGKVLSIEWAQCPPRPPGISESTSDPTVVLMPRVLGLGSKGEVLSIEYWVDPPRPRGRRYGIFSKNEYFYWMNNQIIFWMNKFFEWIFFLYYGMNSWMNQKSAIFIRKMNKKCILRKNGPFCMFSLFSQAEIIFPIWIIFWMNIFVQFLIE